MRVVMAVMVVMVSTGFACSDPDRPSCVVQCSAEGICPRGLVCSSGFCADPGTTCSPLDTSTPDATDIDSIAADAPPDAAVDAMPCTGGNQNIEDPATGHCYLVFTGTRVWTAARDNCVTYSAHLVTLSDANENNLVRSPSSGVHRWIGLSDGPSEGNFQWVNGEPVTFTNWKSGEPNNDGDEDCAGVLGSNGQWNDFDCGDSYQSVCERP